MPVTSVRAAKQTFRKLTQKDHPALEIFLNRHWSTSITLRAYARKGGLVDQGYPFQGTYVAAFDGSTIVAVAAHYTNGMLVVQATQSLRPIVHKALEQSGRPLTAVQGPWGHVEAAVAALRIAPREKFVGRPQAVATVEMTNLKAPENIERGEATARPATREDIPKLLPWMIEQRVKANGEADTPELRATAEEELHNQIGATGLFVAEAGDIVAMARYEIWSPPTIKIGGVYVPEAFKGKGYDGAAVFGAADLARNHGVQRAVILSDRNNMEAQRSNRALGFMPLGEYGTLRYVG